MRCVILGKRGKRACNAEFIVVICKLGNPSSRCDKSSVVIYRPGREWGWILISDHFLSPFTTVAVRARRWEAWIAGSAYRYLITTDCPSASVVHNQKDGWLSMTCIHALNQVQHPASQSSPSSYVLKLVVHSVQPSYPKRVRSDHLPVFGSGMKEWALVASEWSAWSLRMGEPALCVYGSWSYARGRNVDDRAQQLLRGYSGASMTRAESI